MLELKSTVNGLLDSNCQIESIPTSLLALVNMILCGPSIQTQASSCAKSQAGLSISQLLQYNSFVRRRDGDRKRERHNKAREVPLPIYIGLTLHAKTRSRDLVKKLHELGLSISYDKECSPCQQTRETLIAVSTNKMMLCAHQVFVRGCLHHLPLITLTITQARQLPMTRFMAQGYRFFSNPQLKFQDFAGTEYTFTRLLPLVQSQFLNYQSPTAKSPGFNS